MDSTQQRVNAADTASVKQTDNSAKATVATADTKQYSFFGSFPPNVRDLIYEEYAKLCLDDALTVKYRVSNDGYRVVKDPKTLEGHPMSEFPALLQTCKKAAREAQGIIAKHVVIDITLFNDELDILGSDMDPRVLAFQTDPSSAPKPAWHKDLVMQPFDKTSAIPNGGLTIRGVGNLRLSQITHLTINSTFYHGVLWPFFNDPNKLDLFKIFKSVSDPAVTHLVLNIEFIHNHQAVVFRQYSTFGFGVADEGRSLAVDVRNMKGIFPKLSHVELRGHYFDDYTDRLSDELGFTVSEGERRMQYLPGPPPSIHYLRDLEARVRNLRMR